MVIPIENLPAYGGDWIIWFSESGPVAGLSPRSRGLKLEPVEPAASNVAVIRIQIAAVLGTDGKLGGISVLGAPSPALREAAAQDAMEWEFKPATCHGAEVSVEVVREIPFGFPAALTAAAGP